MNELELKITNILTPLLGKSEEEISALYNINIGANVKSRFNMLICKVLGYESQINKSKEFLENSLELKTIRINKTGRIQEHMSFPTFRFVDIANEKWENSTLYNMFKTKNFLFVAFEQKGTSFVLKTFKIWKMPEEILNYQIKETWEQTKQIIIEGNIIKDFDGVKYKSNFPTQALNKVCHVRPHDSTGIDKSGKGYDLPVPDKLTGLVKYTKHCFWLDSRFINSIIND